MVGDTTAKLTGAKLTGANLTGAKLTGLQHALHWLQAVPLSLGLRILAPPAAGPLDARRGPARRGRARTGPPSSTTSERNLLTQIFRFFTQSDVEVNDNYMERYARVFKPTEIKMMLAAFSNIETVHIAAYALLLETIGMPEIGIRRVPGLPGDARQARLHAEVRRRDRRRHRCARCAMFGGFTEGLQLFASASRC